MSPGEHVALVGRSGCGKSTVLGVMAGRLRPSSGEVTVAGIRLQKVSVHERAALLGLAGQRPVLFDDTLRLNLIYGLLRRERGDVANPETFVVRSSIVTGVDDLLIPRNSGPAADQRSGKIRSRTCCR